MKRKLLFLALFAVILSAFFAVSVAADDVAQVSDTYYLVNNTESPLYAELASQGHNVVGYNELVGDTTGTQPSAFFSTFEDGAHVEIIFAEDVIVPASMAGTDTGVLIDKAITVTFKYNGYSHCILSVNQTGGNGIVVRHKDASVRLIGTKGMDADGYVSDVFDLPVIDTELGTCDLGTSNLDVYKNTSHYLIVYKGSVYVENLRGYTTDSLVYAEAYKSESVGPYEIYDSAISAVNNRAVAIASTNSKTIKIDNSYMKGLSGYSVISGSYVYNSTITGDGLHIDSWHNPGHVWDFVNCTITGDRISTSTGRTYLCFTDCTFRENMKWSLSGDNGGNQFLRIYTSATCEQAGTMEMKQSTNRGGENPFAEEYANFYAPALGHTGGADWAYNYAGDKYFSALTMTKGCTRCGLWDPQEVTADAMFQALGYSVPTFGTSLSITLGIKIDREAIAKYEAVSGTTVSFGFVTAAKDCIGEGVCPLDENGNAIVLESGNVVKANITNSINIYTDLKVRLPQDHADTALLMSFYIIDEKDGELDISYAQANGIVENGDFAYVSYNNH